MKLLVNILRIIIGVFFIFSGLLKANDPLGLSYKMEEFFTVWGMSGLNSLALSLSVLMIAFEIIAGAALLIGWRPKLVSWLLLLLIVFFTFLTGYAALSGKFKTCGCMGDCIPIPSAVSFYKDVLLLALILIVFFNFKYIKPLFPTKVNITLLVLSVIFSFASQWYTLNYLSVADCLPFKKGNSIPQMMEIPKNAVSDSTAITFVYEKNGKELEFSADDFPEDFNEDSYKFIKRYDKVVRPGVNNIPPITGFVLTDRQGIDFTNSVLGAKKALVLFLEDIKSAGTNWIADFEKIYEKGREKGFDVYVITSTRPDAEKAFANTKLKEITVLNGDRTMIRTAARTNPALLLLNNGVVAEKWSYREFGGAIDKILKWDAAHFQGIPGETPNSHKSVTGDSVYISL
ncbi:MAG: DoxX family protein [Sphingobacteriales bacterium]|jgi:uncharacterized membrane protein YphA (DoxX/SURF4 family)|nr:DoxX family protein [Sphingobacteriales bacterium]